MKLARREYKFLIDEPTADRIRRALAGYCEGDKHAVATGGRYLCDTLYFDNPDLALYRATIEDSPDRYKLRIRGYPQAPESPVFLEVKRRVSDTIIKTRAAMVGDWAQVLESGSLDAVPREQHLAIENFIAHYRSRSGFMAPAVLVRYEREPYTSLVDYYARVTFDRSVRFQQHSELSMTPDTDHWIQVDDPRAMWPVERSNTILELKFLSASPPQWMRRIVQSLELRRHSFCKYTRAIDAMLQRPDADREPLFG